VVCGKGPNCSHCFCRLSIARVPSDELKILILILLNILSLKL